MEEKWTPVKQIDSEKYNLAWFKLAECVARHEKERALGVLRLLVHSFDDPALAHKLEGDVYLSFHEKEEAISHYELSAKTYQHDKRFLEAAAIYEHLSLLVPSSKEYATILVSLYRKLNLASKLSESLVQLGTLWLESQFFDKAEGILRELLALEQSEKSVHFGQAVILRAISEKFDEAQLKKDIEGYVNVILSYKQGAYLNQFLKVLETTDTEWYTFATSILEM